MDKIDELLTRGVDKIYPSKEELEKVLRSGKKLKLYQGFDPTGTQLHLGHMVGLRKLRQWQDLGHHVIFLIGDFTATVGDPTGKEKTRPQLTKEQVLNNATEYKKQAGKILRFSGENPVVIKYNSEWLEKMPGGEFMHLTSLISYNQIIERDMFQKRLQKNESIGVLELIYPILQGYDSVAMNVDLELGGSDQTFNMLIGRSLVKSLLNKEKFVMTTPLLTDSKGVKIGKTEGNVIALTDKPEDLYGKIMTLPDEVIIKAFEYLTDVPMDEIKKLKQLMDDPMTHKKKLAFEIVKQLNSAPDAQKAQEHFERTVQRGEIPLELPTHTLSSGATIAGAAIEFGFATSRSQVKQVSSQMGTAVNNQTVKDPDYIFPEGESIFKFGKNLAKVKIPKK